MTEENFSPQDSLRLIQSMIDKTRENISDNSYYFLLWGWLTFAGCTWPFILKHILHYEKYYQVWWLTIAGIVFSFNFGIRDGKKKRVKTYEDESMGYLWTGMGISFFVLSVRLSKMGWDTNIFLFFILLYGCFLKFKPLLNGRYCRMDNSHCSHLSKL